MTRRKNAVVEVKPHAHFGILVRVHRVDLRLPTREVAKRLGVSHGYMNAVERGIARPPAEDLARKWATVLAQDPDSYAALALECDRYWPQRRYDRRGADPLVLPQQRIGQPVAELRKLKSAGRHCDQCGSETFVTDSRDAHTFIRRRRQCRQCAARYTTYELSDAALRNIFIQQQDVIAQLAIALDSARSLIGQFTTNLEFSRLMLAEAAGNEVAA